MDTIVMNSKNSKISDFHRLRLNLIGKTNLKRTNKYVTLLNCGIYGELQKCHTETTNLNYHLQHGLINLNFLMDHILCQIFKIILTISLKSMKQWLKVLQQIYVNKKEKVITFKIMARYYLKCLMPETMKLLGSNENKTYL